MQRGEAAGELVGVLGVVVAELAGAPVVLLHSQAGAAVLGERHHPGVASPQQRSRHPERRGVAVEAADVAAALVDPAADVVDLPGGVEGRHLAGHGVGVELPPALVEGRPHRERDHVVQQSHRAADLVAELLASGPVSAAVEPVQPVGDPHPPGGRQRGHQVAVAPAAVDHVLPDQHPDPVAVGIPAQWLDLDVLAEHGEAQRPHRLDVVDHRCVAGRGHQPVGPVALVEHADVRERLVVEEQPPVPLCVLADAERPDRGVGGDHVVSQPHLEVVEVRRLRGPRPHLGERHDRRLAQRARSPRRRPRPGWRPRGAPSRARGGDRCRRQR